MVLNQRQLDNFWAKVTKTDNCWVWNNALSVNGYGKLNLNGKVYYAHKISALISGKIMNPLKKELGAKGEIIMHSCDNRKCVNPEHLVLGTQMENMQDAKSKGRKWIGENAGENNPKAKLSWKIVEKIRNLEDSAIKLAKIFNVDKTTIHNIRAARTWRIN